MAYSVPSENTDLSIKSISNLLKALALSSADSMLSAYTGPGQAYRVGHAQGYQTALCAIALALGIDPSTLRLINRL